MVVQQVLIKIHRFGSCPEGPSPTDGWSVELYNNESEIYTATTDKGTGYSIRLKKDVC